MTQDNLLSSLRAILIIAGSYIVGHNLFGHVLDASTWQIISGAVVTVAMTIWGIASKTTSVEGVESAVRSVITSIGGLLVSYGLLSGDSLTTILGLIQSLAPTIQSALSKLKNSQIASGSIKTTVTGKALKMILILVLSWIAVSGSAQSIFKPIPKPVIVNKFARALTTTTNGDSVFIGFRLTGLTVLYGVSDGYTASNVYAGSGFGWEHDTYSSTTQRWNTDFQVGVGLYAGGHIAPNNLQAATALGLQIGLLNKQIILGVLYNLNSPAGMNSHWVGAIGGNAYLVPTN